MPRSPTRPGPCRCSTGAAAAPALSPRSRIGRLFFSPAERAQLDVARLQRKAPTTAAPEAAEAPPAPEIVTYGGLVRRSDGRQMLWLNNRLVDENEALAGMSLKGKVKPDGAVTLQSQSGAMVDLKVGQSVELYSGRVAETRKLRPTPNRRLTPKRRPTREAAEARGRPPEKPAGSGRETARRRKAPKRSRRPRFGLKMDLGGRAYPGRGSNASPAERQCRSAAKRKSAPRVPV